MIATDGAAAYAEHGVGRSRGTQVFQLAGNIARGGIVEADFGITLRELVEDWGGGTANGRPVRAVQVGGPLGAYLPADGMDLPMDYEAFAEAGAMVGHGGVVVFDDTVDMAVQARFAMEFCAEESCGKCTPCRIGSPPRRRGDRQDHRRTATATLNLVVLDDLCEVMTDGSLCAMGGLTPMPVRSAIRHFPEDFDRPGTTLPPPSVAATTVTPTGTLHPEVSHDPIRHGEARNESARGTRPRNAGPHRRDGRSRDRRPGGRRCPRAPR